MTTKTSLAEMAAKYRKVEQTSASFAEQMQAGALADIIEDIACGILEEKPRKFSAEKCGIRECRVDADSCFGFNIDVDSF